MTAMRTTFCLVVMILAAAGCEAAGGRKPKKDTSGATMRIGVYDSRAIAVAYCGSDYHDADLAPLRQAYEKAKAEGDEKRTSELNAKFVTLEPVA